MSTNSSNKNSATRCFLFGFLGSGVFFVLLVLVLPMYADYRERSLTGEMISALTPIRYEIEQQLLKGEAVTTKMDPELEAKIFSYLEVSETGRIIARKKDFGQMVLYLPRVEGSEVSWECIGGPVQVMPTRCR